MRSKIEETIYVRVQWFGGTVSHDLYAVYSSTMCLQTARRSPLDDICHTLVRRQDGKPKV